MVNALHILKFEYNSKPVTEFYEPLKAEVNVKSHISSDWVYNNRDQNGISNLGNTATRQHNSNQYLPTRNTEMPGDCETPRHENNTKRPGQ